MSADAPMQALGELNGKPCYWAAPGQFETPGFYFWNGERNVHVPIAIDLKETADEIMEAAIDPAGLCADDLLDDDQAALLRVRIIEILSDRLAKTHMAE